MILTKPYSLARVKLTVLKEKVPLVVNWMTMLVDHDRVVRLRDLLIMTGWSDFVTY